MSRSENVKLSIADKIFIFAVFTLSASIPVSKFTTSLSIFLMAFAWFLQWNWKEKLKLLRANKLNFILSTSVFYIFVIGLFYSSDINYALKDLKIKVPLFALPVLLSTGVKLSLHQVKIALGLLCASAITASIIGFSNYQILLGTHAEMKDLREMSPFISHIRLTLILCFSVGYSLWILFNSNSKFKWIVIIPILWIFYFVSLMGSLTGAVILPLVFVFFLLNFLYVKSKKTTIIGLIAICILGTFIINHVSSIYNLVYTDKPVENITNLTDNGNTYSNNSNRFDTENGFRTWDNLCELELKKEWNKISKVAYDSELNGFPFKDVLIRYLTSKGVMKDSIAIAQLEQSEITAIEKGMANVFYLNHNKLSNRIHVTFWELKNLERNGYANGSSITMRFEYWKIAINIFKKNWFIGVGTGDIQSEFQTAYIETESQLDKRHQRRSHNQYLTVMVTLGIVGLIVFLTSLIWPLYKYKGEIQFLYLLFIVILLASMFWEDTIESQAGVTILALVNSLFLFSNRDAT